MEEKKIIVKINETNVELQSNNPNIKNLVEIILDQDDEYDFTTIKIECSDDNFDKDSFTKIIIDSITDFKKLLIIEDKNNNDKIVKIEKEKKENK